MTNTLRKRTAQALEDRQRGRDSSDYLKDADVAIAIVRDNALEEAAKKLSSFKREYDIGDDIHRPMHCRKIDRHNEIMDNIAADLRAMKGKADD